MRLPLDLELDKDCKVGLRLLRAGPSQQSIIAYARTRSEQRTALRTFFFPCWLSLERFERRGGWGGGIDFRLLLPFSHYGSCQVRYRRKALVWQRSPEGY